MSAFWGVGSAGVKPCKFWRNLRIPGDGDGKSLYCASRSISYLLTRPRDRERHSFHKRPDSVGQQAFYVLANHGCPHSDVPRCSGWQDGRPPDHLAPSQNAGHQGRSSRPLAARHRAPAHLKGDLAGDRGFDPLGLGSDPERLKW